MTDSPDIDIIVSGHLCLDLIPDMAHVPLQGFAQPGQLHEVGTLTISTGGVVSNTGLALHRLGANVRLMATVGDDLLGRVIIASLKTHDERLSELISVQPGASSSYSVVLSPERVDRIFLHCTGTNSAFSSTNVDFGLLRRARVFHLGYPPVLPRLIADDGAELSALYRQAQAAGVITSLDMTLPDPHGPSGRANWTEIIQRTLPYVDIFLPSIEEILFMLRRADYETWYGQVLNHLTFSYLSGLAGELLDMGAAVVGFKLGEMGMYLRTAPVARLARLQLDTARWGNRELYSPSYAVNVVSTVGAGDSAYAGFLAALVRDLPPEDCIRWACAVGACTCETPDATSGVRSWGSIQERIESGWAEHDVILRNP